jgi:hypothetical protein
VQHRPNPHPAGLLRELVAMTFQPRTAHLRETMFQYEVFLSHSAKDNVGVRDVTSSGIPCSSRGNEAQSSTHQPSTLNPEPSRPSLLTSAATVLQSALHTTTSSEGTHEYDILMDPFTIPPEACMVMRAAPQQH